jgi:hypothetical protein
VHISRWSFYYWRKRIVGAKQPAKRSPAFFPISIEATRKRALDAIEIEMVGGIRIRLPISASAEVLVSTILALREVR